MIKFTYIHRTSTAAVFNLWVVTTLGVKMTLLHNQIFCISDLYILIHSRNKITVVR